MRKFDIEAVRKFISETTSETKIYIGADSERFKKHGKWFAEYTVAVVIHYDGCRGCKVFGSVEVEPDYDQRKDRPRMRLMNEAIKVAEMYLQLADVIEDRECEIHLDINPDEKYGSSCVISEAVGYIKGMCNITPRVKPQAFAASYTADRLREILENAA
jgi:predicted RNase H-related nuclease YkuK (DUF458 family)